MSNIDDMDATVQFDQPRPSMPKIEELDITVKIEEDQVILSPDDESYME